MIDDIVEGLGKAILKGIARLVLDVLIEGFFFYTGEIVLFIVTIGRRKPRWDYYADESPSKFVIFTEISIWIGVAFWILVGWLVASLIWPAK